MGDQRVAQAVNVHHAARGKVQDGLPQLRRTVGVDAAVIGFALGADDMAPTHRTSLRHMKSFVTARMVFVFDHPRDFGDDIAAALDFHPVADLHAQALDLVHVVQSGAADGGAADGHGLQGRDRREFPGASDLHQNVFDLA